MRPESESAVDAASDEEITKAWKEARAVAKSGTFDELARLVESPWPYVRGKAFRAMGERGMTEAVPLLIEAAEGEQSESVRLAVALALRDLEDPRAADTLWAMVESDPEGEATATMPALQGLSLLGDERVIPVAVSWYHPPSRDVTAKVRRKVAVFDLVLLQTSGGDTAVADLLAGERSWRRRRMIRRAIRQGERFLSARSESRSD